MVMSKVQKKMLDLTLQHAISSEVKRLKKNNIEPTTEKVLKNVNERAIAMLLGQGYTVEELTKTTEDIIGRQKCKE